MTTIAIPFSDERLAQLRLRAEQAGLTPEEFLRLRVEQLLDTPDEQFRRVDIRNGQPAIAHQQR
jgi:ubiquinone/menaquinone biosynthesis C-methylase UbiE